MITLLIDGNNLIGKHKLLWDLQKKDKQSSREKLALIIDTFYQIKKNKVQVYFDGFAGPGIRTNNIRIFYSENLTADEMIKTKIEQTRNRKNLTVVTSDRNLTEFSKACSCQVISCEQYLHNIERKASNDDEEKIIKSMSADEFKKIFKVE